MTTQLEAVVEIDGTDHSLEITEFVLMPTRNTVTIPATYGDAEERDEAGAMKTSCTITCKNELAAATIHRALWTAMLTDDAQLPFSVKYSTAATGADNPLWVGNLVVTEIKIGTEVNGARQMTQTFPVNSLQMLTADP
jgi:hypothetical protein